MRSGRQPDQVTSREDPDCGGIEAAGKDDCIAPELIECGQGDAFGRLHMGGMGGARRKRHVDACALAPCFGATGVERTVPFLMHRYGECVPILDEDRLRAVTVMHLPVPHSHAVNPVRRAGGTNRNGDVVWQSEGVWPVGNAMMPQRAGKRMPRIRGTTVERREKRRLGETSRNCGHFGSALGEGRSESDLSASRIGLNFRMNDRGWTQAKASRPAGSAPCVSRSRTRPATPTNRLLSRRVVPGRSGRPPATSGRARPPTGSVKAQLPPPCQKHLPVPENAVRATTLPKPVRGAVPTSWPEPW